MTGEVWLPVPGYEGLYSVSDQGRVRSEDRYVPRSNGVKRFAAGRILNPGRSSNGYQSVNIRPGGSRTIHSLVMLAFIGPLPAGGHTRHLDGNPNNNTLANLKYGTPQENGQDYSRHKTHCVHGHEFTPENSYIRKDTGHRMCKTCGRERRRRSA